LTEYNPALLHMLKDIAELADHRPLRILVSQYDTELKFDIWRRFIEPNAEFTPPTSEYLATLDDYQRWMLYAVAPDRVELSAEDRADMFDPGKHRRGSLTHQLFAVRLYRNRVGATQELDALVDQLCERIAREARWDFRVTDVYLQRIAFLLAANRADLVKRRWVERVLSNQNRDGGWTASWYGLGPRTFEWTLKSQKSNSHTTVQGLWIYAMLKYRYPHWIEEHYSP